MQGRKRDLRYDVAIGHSELSGYLLSGRDPDRIFDARINEPCRHQPCPYALLGMRVRDSPQHVRDAYRRRSKLNTAQIIMNRLIIYRVELSVREAVSDDGQRAELLDGLENGPADGPAWIQVRDHIDHDRVEAIRFRRTDGMAILVLFHRARELVRITPAEPF